MDLRAVLLGAMAITCVALVVIQLIVCIPDSAISLIVLVSRYMLHLGRVMFGLQLFRGHYTVWLLLALRLA